MQISNSTDIDINITSLGVVIGYYLDIGTVAKIISDHYTPPGYTVSRSYEPLG